MNDLTYISSLEYYDKIAEEYRAQNDFWSNPYDSEIWRLEHDLIKPHLQNNGPMLDVACGFYPHFKFTSHRIVVAGDISYKSLMVARNFGDESGLVNLVQFDAMKLPFRDNAFDSVIAGGELLNHLPDYPIALAECYRVLQPNGILLIQTGSKWCFDSLWAIFDAYIGNRIGYSITKNEARSFFRTRKNDVSVTWGITPSGDFHVVLLSITKLLHEIKKLNFKILDFYGANTISGIVPLPIQQESESRFLQSIISFLIRIDRLVGRLPLFKRFAGNVFIVCQKN